MFTITTVLSEFVSDGICIIALKRRMSENWGFHRYGELNVENPQFSQFNRGIYAPSERLLVTNAPKGYVWSYCWLNLALQKNT